MFWSSSIVAQSGVRHPNSGRSLRVGSVELIDLPFDLG